MLESGNTIADYLIVSPLEQNQVYQACLVKHPAHNEARLLLIDPEQLPSFKDRHNFLEQAKALLGQSFQGAATLLEAQASEEEVFCVYPLPDGQPLEDLLELNYTPRQALDIVRQAAASLMPAHASGFWHGNLTPATIYLRGEQVTLTDFALASLVVLDFHSGTDPRYSSPELVCGEQLGPASDLYSLGIVLYRLLVGAVPFDEGESFATAMQHMQGEVAPLPERLTVFQPLIDGLLKALPDERITAEQLHDEVNRLLALPDIDQLPGADQEEDSTAEISVPAQEAPEQDAASDAESRGSAIERLMADPSDMAQRIEKRLQERAQALQVSAELSHNAKRANTDRMAAVSRQIDDRKKAMNGSSYSQKSSGGAGRFVLLTVLGIAVGIILYFVFFPQGTSDQQQAADSQPTELTAGLERGSELLQAGQAEEAEKVFQGLLKAYAFYPQPYNNLASVYASQGDLERARTYLERALATDEAYATIYRNLGTIYAEMARDSYGRALQIEQGSPSVSLKLFPGDQSVQIAADASKQPPAVAPAEKEPVVIAQAQPEIEVVAEKPITRPPENIVVEPTIAATEPPATEDVAAEPVVEKILEPEPESAETFLNRWAASWSAQDVDAYLSFYGPDFTPSSGASRQDWEELRRSRLTSPAKIEVVLSDFSLVRESDDRLQIEATQSYTSDRYADKTRKLFDLVKNEAGWQIQRERSLGRVR